MEKREERRKEKLREWNATMPNCSAYQREQKGEITLFIAGWALIKQTGSGSCLLQHLSNRKHYKSLKQLPCPSSAQASCSQKESKLNRQSPQPLQVPLPSFKEGETSQIYLEWEAEELLPYRTAPPQEKVKHPQQHSRRNTPFCPSDSTPSAFHLCGLEMLPCRPLNSTDASWLTKLLPNEATNWWSPTLIAAVESSVWMELKFSYQLRAVKPCLHIHFGTN